MGNSSLTGANLSSHNRAKDSDSIKITMTPNIGNLRQWRVYMRKLCAASSALPRQAVVWFAKADTAPSWEELAESPEAFERLDAKLAVALWDVTPDITKRKLKIWEDKLLTEKHITLTGRQVYWHIMRGLRLHTGDYACTELTDLLRIKLHGDNLEKFHADWEYCIAGLKYRVPDEQLESLLNEQLMHSNQLKIQMTNYRSANQRNYDSLMEMLDNFLTQKEMDKNRDQYNRRGAQNALPAPKGGDPCPKGCCPVYWRTGKCAKHQQEKCSLRHVLNPNQKGKGKGKDKGGKGKGGKGDKGKGKGRGKGKGKKGKGKGTGGWERQWSKTSSRRSSKSSNGKGKCRQWLQTGACSRTDCQYDHPPVCKFFASNSCSKGNNCPWLHPGATKTATPLSSAGNTPRNSDAGGTDHSAENADAANIEKKKRKKSERNKARKERKAAAAAAGGESDEGPKPKPKAKAKVSPAKLAASMCMVASMFNTAASLIIPSSPCDFYNSPIIDYYHYEPYHPSMLEIDYCANYYDRSFNGCAAARSAVAGGFLRKPGAEHSGKQVSFSDSRRANKIVVRHNSTPTAG